MYKVPVKFMGGGGGGESSKKLGIPGYFQDLIRVGWGGNIVKGGVGWAGWNGGSNGGRNGGGAAGDGENQGVFMVACTGEELRMRLRDRAAGVLLE
eukprot:582384-Hanusia_phi.AAC.1